MPIVVGISIKAANVWNGGASIEGARGKWNEKASGRVENVYPEFDLLTIGRGLLNLASHAVANAAMSGVKYLGLSSTGRTVATNLTEQLAMKEAMSNPTAGKVIMKGLKDARWSGWSKMQYVHTELNGGKTVIHYVGKFENGVLKYVDDFKFK